MKQEDKDLLLKVLCDGKPYGIIVQYKGHNNIIKDKLLTGSDLEHILESLEGIGWTKVYDIPPYDLTVPGDKVNEINLPKPDGKLFWNEFLHVGIKDKKGQTMDYKKTKPKFKVGDFIRSKDGKIETVVLEIDGGRYRLEDLGWQNINESEWELWDGTTKGYEILPKFCVDDWIVDNCGHTWNIKAISNGLYLIEDNEGLESMPTIEWLDKTAKPWTLADAKDGDILFQDFMDGKTFIYNGIDNDTAILYSFIINNDGREVAHYNIGKPNTGLGFVEEKKNIIHPATKEQRYILFAKMKEAGYEWDSEKKEPIKVELAEWEPKNGDVVRLKEDNGQRWTISLSAEPDIYEKWFLSLNTENGIAGGWVSDYLLKENYTFVNNPLEEAKEACKEEAAKLGKAIAEAVEPTAWSKEDDDMLNDAICAVGAFDYYTYDDKQEIENWLKSLKDRLK